jgi:CRP/FNR family cyclic AMP-dependent transcriptional regulator
MREADPTTFVLILLDGVVKVTGLTQSGRDALLAVRIRTRPAPN